MKVAHLKESCKDKPHLALKLRTFYISRVKFIPRGKVVFRLALPVGFKIFSKFCFLTALLVKKMDNHQMVATTPKIPTVKFFTPIDLMAFCRYSFITFVTASSVAPVMTIKRTAWARKMASFSAPSQICLVIKLKVYRRLPLDCLGFKLNLSRHKAVYVKHTKYEASHP